MSTTTDGANENAAGGSVRGAAGWLEADRDARRAHRTAVTRQAASVLLGHPGQAFFERLPLVARAVAELPWGAVRTALREFCEHASTTPEPELCEHYADVFGQRSLCLSRYGDASPCDRVPSEVARVYAEAGWAVPADEPPDHLTVVLEFAARADARTGEALLLRLRPGLDLLGEALRDHGTPYARVLDAVRMTLPERPGEGGPVHRLQVPPPRTGTDPGTRAGTDSGARTGTAASDRPGGEP
ncbi:nitrate reductase molybdenum cofactor assembly chaperone [Nocardiopsis quinghaiensis]|uniref:nitrate reductase molybdenum cofactor assembly chaperone n=1 Tax=Nocardiopsis quinghaiensis TaxID=464995 RepID=UPI00123A901B|nr:molecular chaperone TorD family protein [Nocardiopsis quinghaiensis]